MNCRSLIVLLATAAAVIVGDASFAEARGFGFNGGTSVLIGIGSGGNRAVRYYGPGFYAAPRTYGVYRQGSAQSQQRPWNYSRSGPYEYYRPYNPLYRTR